MLGLRPKSSLIDRALYDEAAKALTVWFRNGGKYLYREIPRDVFDTLCKAPSAGQYFNQVIKGRFPCEPARRRYHAESERERRSPAASVPA